MKYAILIVLYDKALSESTTYNSIVSLKDHLPLDTSVLVWNNGPKRVEIEQVINNVDVNSRFKVDIVNRLENCALSHVYNSFVDINESDVYVFLDDDSVLTEGYLDALRNIKNNEIMLPHVKEGKKTLSPFLHRSLGNKKSYTAIASGMVITSEVVKIIRNKYDDLFDSRFVLYGVDSTFFYRINKLRLPIAIRGLLNHSLSFNSKDNISKFRKEELTYSLGLQLRYYPSFITLKALLIYMVGAFRGKKYIIFHKLFSVFVNGKHPRL